MSITNNDVIYLRELAKKYLEYAGDKVMEERTGLWYAHNRLEGKRPLVVMENCTFNAEMLPPLRCSGKEARIIEEVLVEAITNYELIGDDKVISPCFPLVRPIEHIPFGGVLQRIFSEDDRGRELGYADIPVITDLVEDVETLKPSRYSTDQSAFEELKRIVEDCLEGILPVVVKNHSLHWHIMPSKYLVDLMGMERMMFAMIDYPEELHRLLNFIKEDILAYLRWQESEDLLTLNNGNDYAGSGSYGFSDQLPRRSLSPESSVETGDLWGNMNSQESVGISPEMYGEFFFPVYRELAREFGYIYYGCCEAVDDVWEAYLSRIPNLKKVSVSPWSDVWKMGEFLRGGTTIFSRKPSPNFIGVGRDLDEEAFRAHISESLLAAKGTTMEIIFRDIYTLEGNRSKPGRAVEIVRELIDSLWS